MSRLGAAGAALASVALTLGFWTSPAGAAVAIAPSADGHLGAWLVAGPLPGHWTATAATWSQAPRKARKPAAHGWTPAWRLISHQIGALDLKKALDVKAGRRPRALLGGVLALSEPTSAWLLVGVDGGLEVYVDGARIWSRNIDRMRGSSWDVIPLDLEAGEHPLILLVERRGQHWAVSTRLLDQATLLAPKNARLRLLDTTGADGAALLDQMVAVDAELTAVDGAFVPRLTVKLPRGSPDEPPLDLVAGLEKRSYSLGRVPLGPRGVHHVVATLPPITKAPSGKIDLTVSAGPVRRRLRLALPPEAFAAATAATGALEAARAASGLSDADVVRATLKAGLRELVDLMGHEKPAHSIRQRARALEAFARAVLDGRDPLHEPGLVWVARRLSVGTAPDPLLLHIPADYDRDKRRRYPLVVALHGYNGSSQGIMRAFVGRDHGRASRSVDGFVVAPRAFGNTFYRGPGEVAVMETIDWMLRTYPVDPARISITGVSMGGTGAAHVAFRYADRFAALAPLAGYHSYFIRRDTVGRKLLAWERSRMHHFSPASWAANGLHLFMHVAHGLKDRPLENSRVLTRRYAELGYRLSQQWPDTGHAVWQVAYAGARLWEPLSTERRPAAPARIRIETDTLRYGRRFWAEIRAIGAPGAMARLRAERVSPTRIRASTEEVTELMFDRQPAEAEKPLFVDLDGQALRFAPGLRAVAHRSDGRWRPGSAARRKPFKRAGLEGPIRDIFLEPLLFVYGSLDKRSTRANREVAEELAWRYGRDAKYAVVPDVRLEAPDRRVHSLFLIGSGRTNAVTRTIAHELPFSAGPDGIGFGRRSHRAPEAGVIFVYPNPDAPDRYVAVVAGVDCRGVWRALSLPKLLPDYLVYDERLVSATAQPILGEAEVAAAGFFDSSWQLPAELTASSPK